MATYQNDDYASKGVGTAGLTLGVIGTALASGILNNGVGGLFGNNNPAASATYQLSQKDTEIAQLKAERYADGKVAELTKEVGVLSQRVAAIEVAEPLREQIIMQNVVENLVVYPKVIAKNLAAELPFMATENILMAAVEAGGDRQDLHEHIRQHSVAAANVVKIEGGENDLLDRLRKDPAFAKVDIDAEMQPERFIGRAPEQVDEFIEEIVEPIRKRYANIAVADADLRV